MSQPLSGNPTDGPDNDRPVLAIVSRTLPPYRAHAHQRFAREIPELRLLTINTHQDKTREWDAGEVEQIGWVDLSNGDRVTRGRGFRVQMREFKRATRAIELLEKRRTAAVIVNGYNDLGRLRIMRWCGRHGIPVFIWADSNIKGDRGLSRVRRAIKRRFISTLASWVSGFFACGRFGRQFWEAYGVPPEKVFLSPYEPDYEQIQSATVEEVNETRERQGLDSGRKRIVFSGRLIRVKRVDMLIEAFQQIAAERPEWDLVILGDGELRSELQARVPNGLADRVRWLGFQSDQSEVSRIYRSSHVLALPSDYEPWALVVNEAVAAGMAVVASDVVGAAAELVEDGVNGRKFPAGELAGLTAALRDVTHADNIDRYRAAAPGKLAEWRRAGDPVQGIRRALVSANAL